MAAVVSAEKEMSAAGYDEELTQEIHAGTAVFYCINTTSHAAWGTLPALMHALFDLRLDVIDHRSWHNRFESTVINEVYVKGVVKKDASILDEMTKVQDAVKDALHQEVSSTSFSCLFNHLSELRMLIHIFQKRSSIQLNRRL